MKTKKLYFVLISIMLMLFAGTVFAEEAGLYEDTEEFTVNRAGRTLTIRTPQGGDLSHDVNSASLRIVDIHNTDSSEANAVWTILIPAGNYEHTNVIRVYSNMTISAEGATIVSTNNKAGDMMRCGWKDEVNTGYSGYKNISVIGGTWDGNGSKKANKFVMFKFGHATNIKIQKVKMLHVKGSHFIEAGAVDGLVIDHCVFKNYIYRKGVQDGQEAVQLDIAVEGYFPNYPAYDYTHCRNVTINACTFDNVERGVGNHRAGVGQYFYNIKITNNTFKNIREHAIICLNFKNSKIVNNKIINCGLGIDFKYFHGNSLTYSAYSSKPNPKANSVISGNTINMPAKRRMGVDSCGIRLKGMILTAKQSGIPKGNYSISGMTVKNNKITGNCRAIVLYSVSNSTFSGNTIDVSKAMKVKAEDDGIQLQKKSVNNRFKNNKISNVYGNGISMLAGCKNNQLTGNTILNVAEHGIHVYDGNTGTQIKNNTIRKCGRNGINISTNSRALIMGNTISNCKAYGVQVYKSAAKAVGNKITGTKEALHFGTGAVRLK